MYCMPICMPRYTHILCVVSYNIIREILTRGKCSGLTNTNSLTLLIKHS